MKNRSEHENNKRTLLSDAIKKGDLENVKFLSPGLHKSIQNNGFPLEEAIMHENIEILRFLMDEFEKTKNDFSVDKINIPYELSGVLLDCVNMKDFRGKENIIQRMLNLGANTNRYYTESNKTALHIAAENGKNEIVQMLLEAGANLNSIDKNGCTPLDLAYNKNHRQCIKILCEFEYNRRINMAMFALLCLSDKKSLFHLLLIEPNVFGHILQKSPSNIFLKMLNVFALLHKEAFAALTLVSARCALESYQKICNIDVPLSFNLPRLCRSQNSLTFFKSIQGVLNDQNLNLLDKKNIIENSSTQFAKLDDEDCNIKILNKFHLL